MADAFANFGVMAMPESPFYRIPGHQNSMAEPSWWASTDQCCAFLDRHHQPFDALFPPPAVEIRSTVDKSIQGSKCGRDSNARGRRNKGLGTQKKQPTDHPLLERERRKNMNQKLSILHSLLPPSGTPLDKKNDTAGMLEEAKKYICVLQTQVQELEKKKSQLFMVPNHEKARLFVDDMQLSGILNDHAKVSFKVFSDEVVINVNVFDIASPPLSIMLGELELHHLDVMDVRLFRSNTLLFQYFHAKCLYPSRLSLHSLKGRLEKLVMQSQVAGENVP